MNPDWVWKHCLGVLHAGFEQRKSCVFKRKLFVSGGNCSPLWYWSKWLREIAGDVRGIRCLHVGENGHLIVGIGFDFGFGVVGGFDFGFGVDGGLKSAGFIFIVILHGGVTY